MLSHGVVKTGVMCLMNILNYACIIKVPWLSIVILDFQSAFSVLCCYPTPLIWAHTVMFINQSTWHWEGFEYWWYIVMTSPHEWYWWHIIITSPHVWNWWHIIMGTSYEWDWWHIIIILPHEWDWWHITMISLHEWNGVDNISSWYHYPNEVDSYVISQQCNILAYW